jgi:hypothetical protein
MKTPARKQFALTLAIVFVIMIIAGCEEQNKNQPQTNVDVKQAHLLVSENVQLQKQLTQSQDELKKCNADLAAQQKLLEEYKKQHDAAHDELEKELNEKVNSVMITFMDKNASLTQEIEKLKEQIKKLKKECEEAKKWPAKPTPLQ